MNRFEGRGNLAEKPELKTVKLENGKTRELAQMRVYFDRQVPDGEKFADKGGFWLNCALWGDRARSAAEVLKKGARVFIQGTLVHELWTDDEGAEREALKLDVDYLAHDLSRVEAVALRQKAVAEHHAA